MVRKAIGKAPTALGRALVKDKHFRRIEMRRAGRKSSAHMHNVDNDEEEEAEQNSLKSVMERNALDEFLTEAMMKEKSFAASRANVIMVGGSTIVQVRAKATPEQLEYESTRIPRRPRWTRDMDADELGRLEREAFLDWRRELAVYEEASTDKHATPFEKNLEVWRQLWRVAERSHVVAQIVDARNPLLFFCADLIALVRELDPRKRCVLVINKADFLPRAARAAWAKYFTAAGVEFIFWSAKRETEAQADEEELIRAFATRRAELIERTILRRRAARAARAMAAAAAAKAGRNAAAAAAASKAGKNSSGQSAKEQAAAKKRAAARAAVATSAFAAIADDSEGEEDEEEEQQPEGAAEAEPEEGDDGVEDAEEDAEEEDAEEDEDDEEDEEEDEFDIDIDIDDDDDAAEDVEGDGSINTEDAEYASAAAAVDAALAPEAADLREALRQRRSAAAGTL